jgi:hypothetical protein
VKEPPPSLRGRASNWEAEIAELKAHPKRWALIRERTMPCSSVSVPKVFAGPEWERAHRIEQLAVGSRRALYVRYVGK